MTNYYVSKSGSNSNSGSSSAPWLAIQYALSKVSAGDTINISQGIYNEQVTISKTGTSSAWITLQPNPSNTSAVIVDGTGVTSNSWGQGVFILTGCHYLRITGLEITNSLLDGIWIGTDTGSSDPSNPENSHIRIDHCYIHECQCSGIKFYAISSVEFDNNTVYRVHLQANGGQQVGQEAISLSSINNFNIHDNSLSYYGREGIDVKGGCYTGSLHHNTIYINNPTSKAWNNVGIYLDPQGGNEHDIDIYNNYISGGTGDDNSMAFGSENTGTLYNINIYNNIIDTSSYGISLVCLGTANSTMHDIYIFNNTVRTIGYPALWENRLSTTEITGNVIIENNIFTTQGATVLAINNYSYPSSVITLSNNLYWNFSASSPTNSWSSGSGWGTNPILKNPLFTSTDNT